MRWAHGFEAEVVDDQERHFGELAEAPVKTAGSPCRMQRAHQIALGDKEHIHPLADGAVPQRLGEMALAGATGSDDQDGCLLLQVTAGSQIMNQRAVQIG